MTRAWPLLVAQRGSLPRLSILFSLVSLCSLFSGCQGTELAPRQAEQPPIEQGPITLRASLRNTGGEWREVELSISTCSPSTPGASTVEGRIRGSRGEKEVRFGLGNRRLATGAGLYDLRGDSPFLGQALGAAGLVVQNGGPHAAGKQFFVLTQSDELVLVREEDSRGRLRPNRGFGAGRQAGRWRAWSPAQVRGALGSGDPAEVLEVLLVLASGELASVLSGEDRARLRELAKRPEAWVAEPARLALGED